MDELKAQGNEQFKRGEYADAIKSYNSAIFIAQSKDKSEEERAAISVLYSNASQAYINNKQYEEAVNSATDALLWDLKAQKALYRRALANHSLEKIDEAKADLASCLELDSTNDEVLKLCKTFGFIDLIETTDEAFNKSGQGWRRAFMMAYFRQHLQEQAADFLSGLELETHDNLQIPLFRMALLSSGFASTLQSLMSGATVLEHETLSLYTAVTLPSAFQHRLKPNVVFASLMLIINNRSLMALFHVIELTDFVYLTRNLQNVNFFVGVLKAKHCCYTEEPYSTFVTLSLRRIVLHRECTKSITHLAVANESIDPCTMSFPSLKTLEIYDHNLDPYFFFNWARNPSSLPIERLWVGVTPTFECLSAFENVCPTLKQVAINCLLEINSPSPFGLIVDPRFRQKAEQLKAFAPNLKEVIALAEFRVHVPMLEMFFQSGLKEILTMVLNAAPKLHCPWAKTEVLVNVNFSPPGSRLRISRSKHLRLLKRTVKEVCLKLKPKSVMLTEGPVPSVALTQYDPNHHSFFMIEIETADLLFKFGLKALSDYSVEFV